MHGRADGRIIDSIEAAAALFGPALAAARDEQLHVAHLDASNRLLAVSTRAGPEERRVELAIRSIIADALRLDSAAIIVAHNHPSGDTKPTAADREATRTLLQVTRPLGIVLRDHLIFAGERILSFREEGLL
jgi:DNA repair protein RadC